MARTKLELLRSLLSSFPLEEYPFVSLGEKLDMKEEEVLETLRKEKKEGRAGEILGEFYPVLLGYTIALYEAPLLKVRDEISKLTRPPFLEIVERGEKVFIILLEREGKPRVIDSLPPSLKSSFQKKEISFLFQDGEPLSLSKFIEGKDSFSISEKEKRAIRYLAKPLSLIDTPFDSPGGESGLGTDEYLNMARALLANKMRFFGMRFRPFSFFGFSFPFVEGELKDTQDLEKDLKKLKEKYGGINLCVLDNTNIYLSSREMVSEKTLLDLAANLSLKNNRYLSPKVLVSQFPSYFEDEEDTWETKWV